VTPSLAHCLAVRASWVVDRPSRLVMGRYTEKPNRYRDICKERGRERERERERELFAIPTSVFGIPKNTENRQLNTEITVRFGSVFYISVDCVKFASSLSVPCLVTCGPFARFLAVSYSRTLSLYSFTRRFLFSLIINN